jgi:hypothetical protein
MHAYHVALNCFRIVHQHLDVLSGADVFALLFSALCHDLDHPGQSNAQLIETKSPLALEFKGKAILEHHSVRVARNVSGAADAGTVDARVSERAADPAAARL